MYAETVFKQVRLIDLMCDFDFYSQLKGEEGLVSDQSFSIFDAFNSLKILNYWFRHNGIEFILNAWLWSGYWGNRNWNELNFYC